MKTNFLKLTGALGLLWAISLGPIQAQPLNLLPTIPEPVTNPHLSTAFDGVNIGSTSLGSTEFKDADECLLAAFAYLHPSSPYKGQQPVLDRLLFLLDTKLMQWYNNVNLADMAFNFQAACAYLMLKTYAPDQIPPNKSSPWEEGIAKNIAEILKKSDVYSRHIVGAIWLNGDIRLAMGGYFGALAIGDNNSAVIFRSVIEDCMPRTLLGDGGTHYVGYQNESSSYHGESTIRQFAWFYILTGSTAVKNFLVASKNYIPLVYHPIGKGFSEWSTAPAWKPYYNQTSLKVEALAKAYLSGDSYNYTIGQGSQHLYLAFLYRSGLSTTTLPDNFTIYDKNILGPRGRYGPWGIVGTTRDPSSPAPELSEPAYAGMDGIPSFVGSYILDAGAGANAYPLDAAFHGAAPEVKTAAGPETDYQRGTTWAFLTGKNFSSSLSETRNVYGLAASYEVAKGQFVASGWTSQQEWITTPDRIIGMTTIENNLQSVVYGLAQRIVLSSGRLHASGIKKTLIPTGPMTWTYGNLKIKVHEQNYGGPTNTFEFGIMKDPQDTYSTMIELHEASDQMMDIPLSYPANTRKYAIFEITYGPNDFAQHVTSVPVANGLLCFEWQDAHRKVRIVHNPTAGQVSYAGGTISTPFGRTRVIESWDTAGPNALPVIAGNSQIPPLDLPPYSNMIILNSDSTDDHQSGHYEYNDLFSSQAATAPGDSSHTNATSPIIVSKDSFFIYPNPVPDNNQLRIHFALVRPSAVQISVFDIAGKLVYKKPVPENNAPYFYTMLDMSMLSKGTYILQIKTNNACQVATFVRD